MTQPFIFDVSAAQVPGSIDLPAAKAAGALGGIVRAEYGMKLDAQFHAWLDALAETGLRAGVYAFQLTDADPCDEVALLCSELAPYSLEYGVSLDVETRNGQSPGNVVTYADAFISETEQARGEPFGMLYTGPGFWSALGIVGQGSEWAARKLWVANYGASSPMHLAPWGKWQQPGGPVLWQAYGNSIWKNQATGEQKWGKTQPAAGWVRIASAYPAPWSKGEVDVSLLPGADDSSLLVSATAGGAAM